MSDNLKLWNSFQPTNPSFVKTFKRYGKDLATINPTYVMEQLTKKFGPCGQGWAFVIDDERVHEGPFIFNKDDPRILGTERLHVIQGHLEYKAEDGSWAKTGPQFGQTYLVTVTNSGNVIFDEEAPKKSVTDCLLKCAVMIGVTADIHKGLWDSSKYVNDAKQTHGEAEPEYKLESVGPVTISNVAGTVVIPKMEVGEVKRMPKGYKNWMPEQWTNWLSSVSLTSEQLETCFDAAIEKRGEDKVVWEACCKSFAAHIHGENAPNYAKLLSMFETERTWLDN